MPTARPTATSDRPRDEVLRELWRLDPSGLRTGQVLRDTFDQLYDGARTQRYRWDQLFKTEKTHFGTLVEINMQREFEFLDGEDLDYCIVGHDVDAKYSQRKGAWMLPPEAQSQLCLVLTANDASSKFSMGLVRALPEHLNQGSNRDAKKTLNSAGREAISWLHEDARLPPNVLQQLPRDDVELILSAGGGTARVCELFRRAIGKVVGRSAVATVAKQLDITRRVRGGSGGARDPLADEGIVILCGAFEWQRLAAQHLGLETPRSTEYVAGYVAPADGAWPGRVAVGKAGGSIRPATATDRRAFDVAWYR